MKQILTGIILSSLIILPNISEAQNPFPQCDSNVPFEIVNLTGQPSGTWYSLTRSRSGHCCTATGGTVCTEFDVTLDSGAAMVEMGFDLLHDPSQAIPSGSLYYQINCGPQIPVGSPICITGVGPHHITFCKPGNNTNTYYVKSIPKPTFPKNDTARIGCSLPLHVLGLLENSVSWTSVGQGPDGTYNSYLSCTGNCDTVLYTPPLTGAPAYVDFKICGTPIATLCGYVAICDTVRIYNFAALSANITAPTSTFCSGGSVLLTGNGLGGQAPYSYTWSNNVPAIVGTDQTYSANQGITYEVRIQDMLYDSLYCPAAFASISLIEVLPPTVNAGVDDTLCPTSPTATINATATNAVHHYWTGGLGTYQFFSSDSLQIKYTPTASEIAAGQVTLTITVTGGGGCSNASDAITLHFPTPIVISMPPQALLCNNSTTILSPVVTGGILPYSYSWNDGQSTPSVSGGAGNYCVGITDNMGCTASACTNVTVPTALTVTISSTDATTNGGTDGSATATPAGGTPPYSYVWSPGGQTTQTANALGYGVYSVVVTDAHGCNVGSSVVVNEPRCLGFQVTTSGTPILCHGDATGTALATVTGGTAPYNYSWNSIPSQNTASATGLSAGAYLVTVTETNGCIEVASIVITQPNQLIVVMNHTNASVVNGTDGTATANPSGGTMPYTYNWAPGTPTGDGTAAISNLSAGVYQVNVIDNNGCSIIDSVQVDEPECASIIMTTHATSVSCFGGSDGSASAQIFFGIPPYNYFWSNGGTTPSITGLSAGTYTVVGWGTLLCTHFANVIVTQPSPLSIVIVPTNVSCNNAHNGTIDLAINGGTYPYTYNWSNGLTVEDQIELGPGTYSVTVTDAHGCTATATTTITQPAPISITSVSTMVTCHGGNNGAIDASISGGTNPYTYLWSNGQTSQDLTNLTYGNDTLQVRDANGCTSSMPFVINESSNVVIDSIHTACPVPGSGVAQVTVYPSGGSNSSYQVSFNNGITFLGSGVYTTTLPVGNTYQVVVIDNNGCSTTTPTTLVIHPSVDVQTVSFNPCIADGVTSIPVTLTTTGGNGGPLQASFDNGTTYLGAGIMTTTLATGSSYNIIVKDSSGCSSVTESISIPNEIILSGVTSAYNTYQVSCFGSNNGTIDLSANGGTGTYSYAWSNASTTQDVNSLAAGIYSVIVTDSLNCKDTMNFTLTQPSALSNTLVSSNNFNGYQVSCNGSTNGAVDLTVNGGVSAYSYSWNNGATTEDLSLLGAGTYSVTITDANGCSMTNSIVLTEPSALTSSTTVTNLTCFQSGNGGIDVTVNGGAGSYSYSWNNAAISQDLNNITAGVYSVIITDENGCTNTQSFTVTEPTALTASAIATTNFNGYQVNCNGSTNGAIDLTVAGGTTGYTFSWSNSATTEDLSSIGAGTYIVNVTDANGCLQTASVTLSEPSLLDISASHQDVPCNGFFTGSIDITMNGGVQPYSYLWSNAQTTEDLNNLGDGSYSVTVTDENGCVIDTTIAITESSPIVLTSTFLNPLCYGNKNGSIDVTVSGGTQAYNYNWSDGQTSQDASDLLAGTYIIIVTDASGCTAKDTISIFNPDSLSSFVTSPLQADGYNISLPNGNDGSINLTVTGGSLPYQYNWSNGNVSEDLAGLSAGSYSVIITDANGCTSISSVTLDQPLVLEMPTGYSPNGDGSNDFFVVHGIEAYPDNRIEIFNRWGNLVYSADHYVNSWNGYNDKGDQLPDGTYFVILEIHNTDIKLNGYVDLRR